MDQTAEKISENSQKNAQTFEEFLILNQYSLNTIKTYLLYEKQLYHISKGELTQDALNQFISVFNHVPARAFMRAYLKYLNAENLFNIPKIRGRKGKKEPKYLNKDDIYSFANLFDLPHKLAIRLLFEGGLRISELLNITWKDINFDERKIKVMKGKGNKFREVVFSEDTLKLLSDYFNIAYVDDNSFLFKTLFRTRHNFCMWLLKNSEAYTGVKISPHCLRHSCGFYLRELGWQLDEIKEYLGHENISTTSIYTHVDKNKILNKAKEVF